MRGLTGFIVVILLAALIVPLCGCGNEGLAGAGREGAASGGVRPTTYGIAGQVKQGRTALAGVTIKVLKGRKQVGGTTTNAQGRYVVTGLAAGRYTVIPSLRGYSFAPLQRGVQVPPSKKDVNFTAYKVPKGGLTDGMADPVTGSSGTNFVYLVTYTNAANKAPVSAVVIVDPGTANETTVPMKKYGPGTNFAQGIQYMAEHVLTALGDHTFRFEFEPVPNKKWTLSGNGPTVE